MARTELCELTRELERYLGDPHDEQARMPFSKVLELDEREQHPHELVGVAQRFGVHEYMIPASHGGKAVNVEDGYHLVRLLARRDPTTAASLMLTTLGFMPVWVAGSDDQRRHFADALLNGTTMAWGLTERSHGSDVIENELRAERVDGGYSLTGEKWLIGNATVADAVAVFARTNAHGGPAGFSIFIVDKRRLPAGAVEHLPNERIHGLRGLDLSGVRLSGAVVPELARIGREGQGLEVALKSSQLARATITSMALACADTALRLATDFARRREIFGQRVSEIPYSRRQLADCLADVLIADAVSAAAVRGLQVAPAQASLSSSIAKYFVPTLLEQTISRAAVVVGARYYLRDHSRYAPFQKLMRDVLVTNFADGNTAVNLKNVALALDKLLVNATDVDEPLRNEASVRAQTLFDLDAAMPPYRPWEQQLFSRGVDDAVLALPASIRALDDWAAQAGGPAGAALASAADVARRMEGELERLRRENGSLRAELGRDYGQAAELFELARQYCAVHAAACCVHLAVHSRASRAHLVEPEALLALSLERLWRLFRPADRVCGRRTVEAAAAALERLHDRGLLFSSYPIELARGAHAEVAA